MTLTIEQIALLATTISTIILGWRALRNQDKSGDADAAKAWQALIAELRARVKELEDAAKADRKRILELETKLSEQTAIDAALTRQIRQAEAQINILENSITAMGGELPRFVRGHE